MGEGSMRRWLSLAPPSPVVSVPLPDNDHILWEILLRLPPRPSSLLRASLVCKRWRRLISEPQFLRDFRALHHRHPPCLGFFVYNRVDSLFHPTLDPPDRILPPRLSLPRPHGEIWSFLGCRHGLALLLNRTRLELTVFDPVSGDQRRVALPRVLFSNDEEGPKKVRGGALFCDDGHASRAPLGAFKVVLLRDDDWRKVGDHHLSASLYESLTGVWGDLISTSVKTPIPVGHPSILVGNSLYWTLPSYEDGGILEFDLDRGTLAVIELPVGEGVDGDSSFQILRIEDSGLGLAILSGMSIQLWERKADSRGVAIWILQKTIELGKLLSLRSLQYRPWQHFSGYDEEGHVIFVSIEDKVFTIQLKSMQFKKLFKYEGLVTCHPY